MKRNAPAQKPAGDRPTAHAAPAGRSDSRLIGDVLQIRRILFDQARQHGPILLHAADGAFIGTAQLLDLGIHLVVLHLDASPPHTPPHWPLPWSATTSCELGMVMFTVPGEVSLEGNLLRLPWPQSLVLFPSRRHRRLSVTHLSTGRAEIVRPGGAGHWAVHNLSEEGVGLMLSGDHGPDSGHRVSVELALDRRTLQVVQLHLVHREPASSPCAQLAGFRMLGMNGDDRQELCRWLAAAERLGQDEGDQAPGSARSKR